MSQVQPNPTPAASPPHVAAAGPATPAAEPAATTQPIVEPLPSVAATAPVQHQPLGKTVATKASIMTCRDTANLLSLACRKSYADTNWARVLQLAEIIVAEASKETSSS